MQKEVWDDVDLITPVYNPKDLMIPVYESQRSDKIATYIPLIDFSAAFKEMVEEGLFEKVYFDNDGLVTAISYRKTYFVPIIANRNQKPSINTNWHKW